MVICLLYFVYFNFVKMKYLKQGKQVNLKTSAIYCSMGNTIPGKLKMLSRSGEFERGVGGAYCVMRLGTGGKEQWRWLAEACPAWPRTSQTRQGREA